MFGIFHLGASCDDTSFLAAELEAIDSVGGVVHLGAMEVAGLDAGVDVWRVVVAVGYQVA